MNKLLFNEAVQIIAVATIIFAFIITRITIAKLVITKTEKHKYYFMWWIALSIVLSTIYF